MKTKLYLPALIVIGLLFIAAGNALPVQDLAGTWKYTISDVPPEYESGFLVFEQKDNKLTGYVEGSEKREMQGLTAEQGKVIFTTEDQNGVFKYSFEQKGDTLTGMIASQYGDFPIKAVKQAGK